MRAVNLFVTICFLVSLVRGARISLGKRSASISSHFPTGSLASSSPFSSGCPSHFDSIYTPDTSKSTSLPHTTPYPTSMVTRTRTPNGTPHASMSSEIPAPSSQTQRSGFSTSSTQISTTSGTSSLIDHPSNKPTENSVPPSVPGLVGTSASLVPGTSTPDETPNSSNDSSDTTSHRALATTTDISSSTEDGIVALATYSSRSVTSVTTVKGVTSNSHTSTVGTDHHTTLIPIVGGSLCWVWDHF